MSTAHRAFRWSNPARGRSSRRSRRRSSPSAATSRCSTRCCSTARRSPKAGRSCSPRSAIGATLPADLRELVDPARRGAEPCAVRIRGARVRSRAAAGVSEEKLAAIRERHDRRTRFTRSSATVLALTDAMTRDVQVPRRGVRAAARALRAHAPGRARRDGRGLQHGVALSRGAADRTLTSNCRTRRRCCCGCMALRLPLRPARRHAETAAPRRPNLRQVQAVRGAGSFPSLRLWMAG